MNKEKQKTMRKIIALEFMSLDGVIQAPGGPEEDTSGGFKYGGWTFPYFGDEELGQIMDKQMKMPFELLLGRKTFDIFSSYWPQNGEKWQGVNETKKYVVTNTLTSSDWNNSTIINGDVVPKLRKLKEESGPDMHVYGSSKLMQTLLQNDLVDEFWLKIFPITLGSGKKLFADGTRAAAFKLTFSKVASNGVIVANYKRDGDVKTGSFDS